MKKLLLLFLLVATVAVAQDSAITAIVKDGSGQAFLNGTWAAEYVKPVGTFYTGDPVIKDTTTPIVQRKAGNLTSLGELSTTLTRTDRITPAGGKWKFTFCSAASSPCSDFVTEITTPAVDLTAAIQAAIPDISVVTSTDIFNIFPKAYLETEVMAQGIGSAYFNLLEGAPYFWDGSLWKSLKGDVGPQGPQGTQGIPGATGPAGPQGALPVIDVSSYGGDLGVKIASAMAALPATGGILDARGLHGAQAAAATITLSKPVKLLLADTTVTLNGCPGIQYTVQGVSIEGLTPFSTIFTSPSTTCDIVQVGAGANFWDIEKVGFRTTAVTRTAGAGFRVKGGNGYAAHLRFDKTYNGIQITDNGSGGDFWNIQMGSGLATGGNWNAGIIVGTVPTGTVTTMNFDSIRISTDAPFADAAVAIYDGVDALTFNNVQVGQTGTSNPAVALRIGRTGVGLFPEWVKFSNCHWEAPDNTDTIIITEGRNIQFVNNYIAHGRNGLTTNTCIGCSWIGGEVFMLARHGFVLNGGLAIMGTMIGEVSTETTNTYDGIFVAANVSDFRLQNITFTDLNGGHATNPKYNVEIAAGTSTRYWVTNNNFGGYGTGPFQNGGTGSQQYWYGNQPSPGGYMSNGLQVGQCFALGTISDPSITWCAATGAPVGACASGSLYSRRSGGAGTSLYVCESGAWVAK